MHLVLQTVLDQGLETTSVVVVIQKVQADDVNT